MTTQLKEMPHLLLWRLVVGGGESFMGDLPAVPKAARDVLIRAGLVHEEKRVRPGAKRKTKSVYLSVTEQGWAWCHDHMTWPANARSAKSAKVLELLLPRLHAVIQRRQPLESLGDFITKSQTAPPADIPPAADVHQAIRDACHALGGTGVRIRIAEVRLRLGNFGKEEVSKALWDLSSKGELSLYQLDNPRDIDAADRDAAVLTSTGDEKHLIYFGGPAS